MTHTQPEAGAAQTRKWMPLRLAAEAADTRAWWRLKVKYTAYTAHRTQDTTCYTGHGGTVARAAGGDMRALRRVSIVHRTEVNVALNTQCLSLLHLPDSTSSSLLCSPLHNL